MTSPLTLDLIRAFPKVELHVHVEACISGARIEEFANEVGVPMLRPVNQLFEFSEKAALHAKIDTFLAANGHD